MRPPGLKLRRLRYWHYCGRRELSRAVYTRQPHPDRSVTLAALLFRLLRSFVSCREQAHGGMPLPPNLLVVLPTPRTLRPPLANGLTLHRRGPNPAERQPACDHVAAHPEN